MTTEQSNALTKALLSDYEAVYGPRKKWPKKVIDRFHVELGIMVQAVIILQNAGLLAKN